MSSKKEGRSQLLSGLMERKPPASAPGAPADKDRVKSASITTMGASIRELGALGRSQNAESGAAVLEIDPSELESSVVRDRLASSIDESFELLVKSMQESGQQVPILVRRHPTATGRFQIAYGHRRARAAAQLGIKIKAIVRPLTDDELVIAQGKENLERRDLSFIEKAMFARRLEEQGFNRATIIAALSTDKADLSRYISLAKEFDVDLLEAIGPAPKIGRARWQALAKSIKVDGAKSQIAALRLTEDFKAKDSDARFNAILHALHGSRGQKKPPSSQFDYPSAVQINRDHERTTITIDESVAPRFADFLAARLMGVYAEFLKTEGKESVEARNLEPGQAA